VTAVDIIQLMLKKLRN